MPYTDRWEEGPVMNKCVGCVPEEFKIVELDDTKPVLIGIDYGKSDMNCEVVGTIEPDGKIKIISVNQWNKELELKAEPEDTADWTRKDIILVFECKECRTEFDCNTTSFKVLCDSAIRAGWKMKWLDMGYETICKECGE